MDDKSAVIGLKIIKEAAVILFEYIALPDL
jgi:hypothetical protein